MTNTVLSDKAIETFGSLHQQLKGHDRLIQAISRNQYVLFLGAGIAGAVGYPGWQDLVDGVRREVGRTIRLTTIHPLEQAQIVWNHYISEVYKARPITDATQRNLAEQEFNKIVLTTLEKLRKSTERPDWFDSLQDILPQNVVTTNWDKVIERNLFDSLVNCFCFHGGKPTINPDLPNLYKIHGDVEDYRYLVFTEDQFFRWEQDDPYLVAKLTVMFSEHVTLCLGYSFRDPNVQHQHFRAFLRFQGATEPVYLLFDPAKHPANEWGLLREQREYFRSRNVTLLFGSIPELLEFLKKGVEEYNQSAIRIKESITPVLDDLKKWIIYVAPTTVKQHSMRLPKSPSVDRRRLLINALIQVGQSPDVREHVGLSADEGLSHELGLCILSDIVYLLSSYKSGTPLSSDTYEVLIRLTMRFTTQDSGAWQFSQQRERMAVLLDLLPLIPTEFQIELAPAFAEHLLFAGPSLGECWGSWNDLNRRIGDVPIGMLKPVLEEIIPADNWRERLDKIRVALSEENGSKRLGIRLRLLQKHPSFNEVLLV